MTFCKYIFILFVTIITLGATPTPGLEEIEKFIFKGAERGKVEDKTGKPYREIEREGKIISFYALKNSENPEIYGYQIIYDNNKVFLWSPTFIQLQDMIAVQTTNSSRVKNEHPQGETPKKEISIYLVSNSQQNNELVLLYEGDNIRLEPEQKSNFSKVKNVAKSSTKNDRMAIAFEIVDYNKKLQDFTEKNLGERLALVNDNKILAVITISEPIRGNKIHVLMKENKSGNMLYEILKKMEVNE